MDIHKPKPIHGWRDFLKEIGVIVIGVSIALAGEQAVEKWRDHRQYVEALEAMRAELSDNLFILARRPLISACASVRMREISALLDKAEKHESFSPPNWIGGASGARIRYAAENETSRSGLFSPADQRQYNSLYSYMHSIEVEQDRERQAWGRLEQLEGRSSAPPEMIANLRDALAQARFEDERIRFLVFFVNNYSVRLSIRPREADLGFLPRTWPHCVPMNTPREDAERLSAYRGICS